MCLITTITFYVAVNPPPPWACPTTCLCPAGPPLWYMAVIWRAQNISAVSSYWLLILMTDRSLHTFGRCTQGLSSGWLSMSRLLIVLLFTQLSSLDIQLLTFPPPPLTPWRLSGVAVEQCQRWALIRGICQRVEAVTGGWWELGVYAVKTVGNLTPAH